MYFIYIFFGNLLKLFFWMLSRKNFFEHLLPPHNYLVWILFVCGGCHYLFADLLSKFSSINFHLCLHMDNISDLLFNDVLLSASKMKIFSAMHKLQFFAPAT